MPGSLAATPAQLVVNDINSCNSAVTGSIDASGIVPLSGSYRYELYEGASVSGPTGNYTSADGRFDGLDDRDYVLVVYDNTSGCNAPQIPFTLDRNEDKPQISTALTHDGSCSAGSGSIRVTTSMPVGLSEPASYTYQLFDGHGFAAQIGTDQTINDGSTPYLFEDLEQGNYRVNIINDDSECEAFIDVVINDETVDPAFLGTASVISENTSCDATTPNGSLTVAIDGGVSADYVFRWYEGQNTSGVLLLTGAGEDQLEDRSGGFYTVVAAANDTGCETPPLTLEIADDPYIPAIVIVEESPQTRCDGGDGSLRAYVVNPPAGLSCIECAEADGFSFQWKAGPSNLIDGVDPGNGSVPSGATTSTITGLTSDEYTVTVTFDALSCDKDRSFNLSKEQAIPVLTVSDVQPNTGCNASTYDGSISIAVAAGSGGSVVSSPVSTGYTFQWRTGGVVLTDGGSISGSDSNVLSGVEDGTYQLTVTSPLGCTSDEMSVVVPADPSRPDFTAATVNNTACDATLAASGNFTGQITLTPNTGAVGDFTYEWFDGSGTTTPHTPAPDPTAANVLPSLEGGVIYRPDHFRR